MDEFTRVSALQIFPQDGKRSGLSSFNLLSLPLRSSSSSTAESCCLCLLLVFFLGVSHGPTNRVRTLPPNATKMLCPCSLQLTSGGRIDSVFKWKTTSMDVGPSANPISYLTW